MKSSSVEQAILELCDERNCHMSAQEVFQRLHTRFPAVNPSTIYRALERMSRQGLVSIADLGTGAAVYEKVSDRMHHHLVCQICGSVQTIDDEEVGTFFKEVGNQYHFKVNTNHLILFGECAACKKAEV